MFLRLSDTHLLFSSCNLARTAGGLDGFECAHTLRARGYLKEEISLNLLPSFHIHQQNIQLGALTKDYKLFFAPSLKNDTMLSFLLEC